jgi:predicted deacylase
MAARKKKIEAAPQVEPFVLHGTAVEPGTMARLELPMGNLPMLIPVHLHVVVVHGTRPGPVLWVSAALHGDELNGVEIVRQVLGRVDARELAGTLIAVPIVNAFGFLNESRYLPDRRDLNRSFPGCANGSLAARVAHLFMQEVVSKCTHGIDLHTGSDHRTNWPQVRANLLDPHTQELAWAFGAPVMMHAGAADGTIRKAATKLGIPVLLYEGGEPLRFDEGAIEIGREGVLRVMDKLGMRAYGAAPEQPSFVAWSSKWARAKRAGILRLSRKMGDIVKRGERLGAIEDALGERPVVVKAPCDGMIVGLVTNPLVYQGDAIAHIAAPGSPDKAGGSDEE